MEALGSYLKEVREKLNLSIDKVADDTHIVKKFIEAIEVDEYSIFPGEAYLRGFLRTYSEYLGIDSDDTIRRYEKIKVAESPMPMEQLIPKPKFDFRPVIVTSGIVLIAALVLVGIVMLTISIVGNVKNAKPQKTVKVAEKKVVLDNSIKMVEKEAIYNLKKNDIVEFNIGSEKYSIKVKELNPTVIITDNSGKDYILIKSYQQKIDVNNDQLADIEITLNFWDEAKSANITMKLLAEGAGEPVSISSESSTSQGSSASAANINIASLQGNNIEIIGKKSAQEAIVIEVHFQDETLFKYKADDKSEIESYYKAGSVLNITAAKVLVIGVSNAGAASLNFKSFGKTFKAGDTGKVEIKLVKWVQNSSGEFELQTSTLK
jgi:cytoskeleton protein RodZ